MAKFKVETKVKISKELTDKLWSFGITVYPIDIFEIRNVVEREDGATVYDLRKVGTLRDIYEVPEEAITIAEVEELPLRGLIAHDLENHTIGKILPTVSILGTTYTIQELSVAEDISLKDCDGYCDKTDKRIVIAKKEADCDLGDFEQHRKKTMRHEIIHAYFNESGLAENFENKRYGIPETLVDWFAIQSPKIYKTFAELDIL